MCTMGLHSVGWNYDYACMGLDLKDIPPRDQHWEVWDYCQFLLMIFLPSARVLLRIASSHVGFSAGPRLVTTFHCIVLVESFFFLVPRLSVVVRHLPSQLQAATAARPRHLGS